MEVETRGVVRTMAVVLMDDDAAAEVRVTDSAAFVSLEGTRLVGAAAADESSLLLLLLLSLLLLLLGAGAEVCAGGSGVVSAEEGAGDDAGGAALVVGAVGDATGVGVGVGVGVAAGVEVAELPPVPEACRFSLWCRYSLMPSMYKPSKLKADAMATKAKSVTNSHAWRNMVMSGEWKQKCADLLEAAGWMRIYLLAGDAFHE